MHLDLHQPAGCACALLQPSKVECTFHAEPADDRGVGFGQAAEVVGAEKLPPTNRAPLDGRVAAQIAEIAGAFEIEMTVRDVLHRISLGHRSPRTSDG